MTGEACEARLEATEERLAVAYDALDEIRRALDSEMTASRKVEVVAGVVTNGPLDTAPGGPREDECWRLRERLAAVERERDEARRQRDALIEQGANLMRLPREKAALRARVEELEAVVEWVADVERAQSSDALEWAVEAHDRAHAALSGGSREEESNDE